MSIKSTLLILMASSAILCCSRQPENNFILNQSEYFENGGVNVMAFQDIYPDGHQSGVSILMHNTRIATNGDVRLEATPGQWSPMPVQRNRVVDLENQIITTTLSFPDSTKKMRGFNPIWYPNLEFSYDVKVSARGNQIHIAVDLDRPIPDEWADQVGFIMELYPVDLFGKSWVLDGKSGIFTRQANGASVAAEGTTPNARIIPSGEMAGLLPLPHHHGKATPMATGRILSVAPESEELRMTIETLHGELELIDGRIEHNNGWFVVRSVLRPGATQNAAEWIITPHVIEEWKSKPVLQYSQVGYHPLQKKVAVIETDTKDKDVERQNIQLIRLQGNGRHETVRSKQPEPWGKFLRYKYYQFDFSDVNKEGMYQLVLGDQRSEPFRISEEVYKRHVWQPTLEYFLPVQMCHVRVKEKYKLWHDCCHHDDALMAPINLNHFDGYVQGPSTLTRFKPFDHVPGLNRGGWHDAGDDDLRIESQSGEIFILSAVWDEFRPMHDNTLIDQERRIVEIHEPDGKPDILQQIEHGYLTVVGGYQALGRLYRGIISPTLSQYVLAGDVAGQTDNLIYDPKLQPNQKTGTHSGIKEDRMVFTENNPGREWQAIANIASGVNAMRGYNDKMAADALRAAVELWNIPREVNERTLGSKVRAAVELFRATGNEEYRKFILDNSGYIIEHIRALGWQVARVVHQLGDAAFTASMAKAVGDHYNQVVENQKKNPYGVPFEPHIWGAGWGVQRFGFEQYFLNKAFPQQYGKEYLQNALNFVLGCHPGTNNVSYASGVGAKSMTVAYGYNRMDYGYIPGGVVSGTALIRPDFPELKNFPYLWQQSEYVMGGGATHFMFLVLAADHLLKK